MTSWNSSHAEKIGEMSSKQSTPKVQVQRSVSRETITIHFSAFGKEEEEEEEEFKEFLDEELDDQSIVTALEAKEDLCFEHTGHDFSGPATSLNMANSASPLSSSPAVLPTAETVKLLDSPSLSQILSAVPPVLSPSSHSCHTVGASGAAAPPVEQKSSLSSSPSSSPFRSVACSSGSSTVSSSKPFKGLVKSFSTEVEPKEPTPPMRHRQLMKTLVKSLSTDTSKQESEAVSYRPPDSKLNLHLFKQFTQPRATGGDSKTAPSSPLTSPSDTRSFFKVPEMEAKIEDTKRRLSEVIYEPLQLLSKIMGDESSSHRPKALSSSASELSNLSSLNGHLESNNNYSIKEEECDSEGDFSGSDFNLTKSDQSRGAEEHLKEIETKSSQSASTKDVGSKPSLVLEKCSLSALVSREDEEFCELYSEDFFLLEEESKTDKPAETVVDPEITEETVTMLSSEDENNLDVQQPKIPVKTLYLLTLLVYAYFIIPLPGYVSGLLLGMALGFMVAVCVIWLLTPRTHEYLKLHKSMKKRWNTGALDIKEPEILKGWMNEIYNYDPETYHATLTHSVYVRLEGSTLRLSKPNKNISRRAVYNEPKPEVTYISQKIYELTDSKISLVPKSLARKRIWNKKYPICIELAKQDDFMAKAQIEKETAEEKLPAEKVDLNNEESKKPQDGAKYTCQKDQVLYLFGRTGREKEEWFRRFLLASKLKSEAKKPPSLCGSKPGTIPLNLGVLPAHSRSDSQSGVLTHSRSSSKGSAEEITSQPKHKDLAGNVRQKMLLDYNIYMAKCVPQEKKSPSGSPVFSADSSPTAVKKLTDANVEAEEEEQEVWVNALLGRIFWDFLGEKYWSDLVSKKIQMKLSKIKLPYFMNELTLTELDMGIAVPKILQAFKPSIDHRGLWIDLEMYYNGSFLMTLETKMNLTKLGKEPLGEALKVGEIGKEGFRPRAYCLADSDEESSSAGSSEEDDAPELAGEKQVTPGGEGYVGGHRTSKIMRIVDKITKSKYFQKATETEFIKKKIEEVSNTPLLLTVEVQECRGTLVINIPPPPTDRIWYGFRRPPYLELKARPKLGEREVTLVHVTDWIARKLEQEFQKIFVMPNMDDVYIPLMHSAMDPRSSTCLPQDLSTEASDQP
ncbi:PREDICTED: testis-expressed sequence 2 protein isoform X1 [Corvus brachyrhynchos]|uniref:testis-expressed sequence 2 protein isoform X1 n=1 Tax=Corvus brachyrhynchos TaxID=85066 RepID=UPI0004DE0C36|nr:PREDICTED: testis-expressed sequence 2 protein isoform X1 [Corvus brachyrhynchos]XP_017594621.1 PREDICTED: testis-expressed sequence 2 protein isoform X1 [Corvus brachyrhynchos]